MKKKKHLKSSNHSFSKKIFSQVLLSAVISIFVTAAVVFAWTEPTVAPPGGNIATPVNTGDTTQYKSGTLGVGGVFRGYGNGIFDGNVGIGVTGPAYKLVVNGVVSLSGPTSDNSVLETTADVNANYLVVGKSGYWGIRQGSANSINFDVYNSGTEKAAMTILQNGNVGIGTAGPTEKLTVAGGHGDTKLRLYSTGNGGSSPANLSLWASEPGWTYYGTGLGYNVNGSPYYGRIDSTRGSSYVRFLPSQTKFEFQNTSNTYVSDVLVINDTGNVGIGTASPGQKLTVAGNIDVGTNYLSFGGNVTVNSTAGINWNTTGSPVGNYSIHRSSGTWDAPYQQIVIDWPTGIVLNPGSSYGKSYVDVQGGGLRTNTLCLSGTCRTTWPSDPSGAYLPLAGGTMNAGSRVAFSGSSITSGNAYGIGNGAAYSNVNSIAVDTLETDGGVGGSGTLELNYYGGGEVHIGPSGTKALRAALMYDGNNGSYYVDPGSTSRMNEVQADRVYGFSDIRSPIFYDYNNTAYYVDPNSTSRMNEIQADRVYGFSDIRSPIFYDYNDTAYYVDPNSTSRLNYGVFNNAYSYGWMQTPIFYDANNTGYYVDPAGTSNLNTIGPHTVSGTLNMSNQTINNIYQLNQWGGNWNLYSDGSANFAGKLTVSLNTGIGSGIAFGSNYRLAAGPYADSWLRIVNTGDNNYAGGNRTGGLAASNLYATNDIYLGAKGGWLGDIWPAVSGQKIIAGKYDPGIGNCLNRGNSAWVLYRDQNNNIVSFPNATIAIVPSAKAGKLSDPWYDSEDKNGFRLGSGTGSGACADGVFYYVAIGY